MFFKVDCHLLERILTTKSSQTKVEENKFPLFFLQRRNALKNGQIWLGLYKSSHSLTHEQQAFEQHHQSHFQIYQPDQRGEMLLHTKLLSSTDELISSSELIFK